LYCIKGTSIDQDGRFTDKEKKLIAKTKFPPEFDTKVDLTKVEINPIRQWIARRVTELLETEDDIIIELICNQLEASVWHEGSKQQQQILQQLQQPYT
jgi:serine/arginine repetitive matrix protein 1